MINSWWQPLRFAIQEGSAGEWSRIVDTHMPSPADIVDAGTEAPLLALEYSVAPRSIVVLSRRAPR